MQRLVFTFGSCQRDQDIMNNAVQYMNEVKGKVNSRDPYYRELDGNLRSMSIFGGTVSRVVVMSRDPKRGVTQRRFDDFLAFVRSGFEPTTRLPNSSQPLDVRKLQRLKNLVADLSYIEVTIVDDEDNASVFLRKDGCLFTDFSSDRVHLKISCYCKLFYEYGGVCTCSLIYASEKKYLFGGHDLDYLQTCPIFSGKKRLGPPLYSQEQLEDSALNVQPNAQNWSIFKDSYHRSIAHHISSNGGTRVVGWMAAFKHNTTDAIGNAIETFLVGHVLSPVYEPGTIRLGTKTMPKAKGWTIAFDGGTQNRIVNEDELLEALAYGKYMRRTNQRA